MMRSLRRRLKAVEEQLRNETGACPDCSGRTELTDAGQPVPTCQRCGREIAAAAVAEVIVYRPGEEPRELSPGCRAVFYLPDNGRDALPGVDVA